MNSYLGLSHLTERFIPAFMAAYLEVTHVVRLTDRGPRDLLGDFDVAVMTEHKHARRPDITLRVLAWADERAISLRRPAT